MRGRVLVELSELDEREHDLLVAVHCHGQGSHDGLGLAQRELVRVGDFLVDPADRVGLF